LAGVQIYAIQGYELMPDAHHEDQAQDWHIIGADQVLFVVDCTWPPGV
jgi:hypothetical protein